MWSQVLEEIDWKARQSAHRRRVEPWVRSRRDRQQRGIRHPVDDFLFEYYWNRVTRLLRWHPGLGVWLRGNEATEYLTRTGYVRSGHVVGLDAAAFVSRLPLAQRVATLLTATQSREPELGCFGLHEWAMVYRMVRTEVRHPSWPLRLPREEIAKIVEARPLRCTHFDAFRFFTPPARSLNLIPLTRDDQVIREQPGCLHANMDLYKWTYKLSPLIGSDLVADAFQLARELRELDMRASPYDLSELGYEPIRIETSEGRATYVASQKRFATRANVLRQSVLEVTIRIAETLGAHRQIRVDQFKEPVTVE